jgi:hypothetical protein
VAFCDGEHKGANRGCRLTASWITPDGRHWCGEHVPDDPAKPWERDPSAQQLLLDEIKPDHEPLCPDFPAEEEDE